MESLWEDADNERDGSIKPTSNYLQSHPLQPQNNRFMPVQPQRLPSH
jgi:hypothetical protein